MSRDCHDPLYRWWKQAIELSNARKIARDLQPPARKSRDVYCYFDNDMKVKAPFDARRLIRKLGLPAPAPASLPRP